MTDRNDENDTPENPADLTNSENQALRNAVRYFYDLQRLRIAAGNRAGKVETQLTNADKAFLTATGKELEGLEKDCLREVKRLLKGKPVWEEWLSVRPAQKGCGPTMSGLIVSHIDISRSENPSQLWSLCGLGIHDGKADRRKKGEKVKYNPFLKTKLLGVLGGCLLKANSPWRKQYDEYRDRKTHQILPVCMGCEGKGTIKVEEEGQAPQSPKKGRVKKDKKCPNCDGTGGPAPWGRSEAHRHQAAIRYMVKQFMLALWVKWRTLEGLPIRDPYLAEYTGQGNHDRWTDHGRGPFGATMEAPRELSDPLKQCDADDLHDAEIEAELEQEDAA